MDANDLEKLHAAVAYLLRQRSFTDAVKHLNAEVERSTEPFVWSTIALESIEPELPATIKSCWVFVLKKGVPSGCHYHPNSIQHMVALNGRGTSNVGGKRRAMVTYGAPGHALADKWYVIDQGVPHEFFPEREHMTVVSFHTCGTDELKEVACDTGVTRVYETHATMKRATP